MKRWLLLLLTFVLTACTAPLSKTTLISPTSTPAPAPPQEPLMPTLTMPAVKSAYPDLGPAPQLSGEVWLNTAAPLRRADLVGKVILVDMWTFG